MLWKSATKNFYSVIISHYTRENFYSVIISHYTREKCNHKKFQCYISLFVGNVARQKSTALSKADDSGHYLSNNLLHSKHFLEVLHVGQF